MDPSTTQTNQRGQPSCQQPGSIQCDSHPEIRDALVEIRTICITHGKEIRDTRRRIDRMYRHMMPARKEKGDATVNVNTTATGSQVAPGAATSTVPQVPAVTAEWNRVTYTLLLALAVALLAWATQGPPAGAAHERQAPPPIAAPK